MGGIPGDLRQYRVLKNFKGKGEFYEYNPTPEAKEHRCTAQYAICDGAATHERLENGVQSGYACHSCLARRVHTNRQQYASVEQGLYYFEPYCGKVTDELGEMEVI